MSSSEFANSVSRRVIACAIRVHQALGPGFLENIYRRSLLIEFRHEGLATEFEKQIFVYYRDLEVGRHRLDFLVENILVVELKTVESLSKAHYAQLRSYLAATGVELGLLINFAGERADFRRIHSRPSRRIYEV